MVRLNCHNCMCVACCCMFTSLHVQTPVLPHPGCAQPEAWLLQAPQPSTLVIRAQHALAMHPPLTLQSTTCFTALPALLPRATHASSAASTSHAMCCAACALAVLCRTMQGRREQQQHRAFQSCCRPPAMPSCLPVKTLQHSSRAARGCLALHQDKDQQQQRQAAMLLLLQETGALHLTSASITASSEGPQTQFPQPCLRHHQHRQHHQQQQQRGKAQQQPRVGQQLQQHLQERVRTRTWHKLRVTQEQSCSGRCLCTCVSGWHLTCS